MKYEMHMTSNLLKYMFLKTCQAIFKFFIARFLRYNGVKFCKVKKAAAHRQGDSMNESCYNIDFPLLYFTFMIIGLN